MHINVNYLKIMHFSIFYDNVLQILSFGDDTCLVELPTDVYYFLLTFEQSPFGYCSVTTIGISRVLAACSIRADTFRIWG